MNGPTYNQKKIFMSWQMLKFAYGILFIVAGADKFLNLVTYWPQYLSTPTLNVFPFSPMTLSQIIGAFEIALGAALLSKWTRIAAYVATGWLLLIAFNLCALRLFDIAVRDTMMAIASLVLGYMST